jgi:hypothetical protein
MPSKSYIGTVPAGGNTNRVSDPPGEETVSVILEIGLPPSKEVARMCSWPTHDCHLFAGRGPWGGSSDGRTLDR